MFGEESSCLEGCLTLNNTLPLSPYRELIYVRPGSANCTCPDGAKLRASASNGSLASVRTVSGSSVVSQNADGVVTVYPSNSQSCLSLMSEPGFGYCVDNSLEEYILERSTSNLPSAATTSVKVSSPHGGRLAVAACCDSATGSNGGEEVTSCVTMPIADKDLSSQISSTQFQSSYFGGDTSCMVVTNGESAGIPFCISGNHTSSRVDEVCVDGTMAVVCSSSQNASLEVELGCPTGTFLMYNAFVSEFGALARGYQMRGPYGYANGLVEDLGCIEGDLSAASFAPNACKKASGIQILPIIRSPADKLVSLPGLGLQVPCESKSSTNWQLDAQVPSSNSYSGIERISSGFWIFCIFYLLFV